MSCRLRTPRRPLPLACCPTVSLRPSLPSSTPTVFGGEFLFGVSSSSASPLRRPLRRRVSSQFLANRKFVNDLLYSGQLFVHKVGVLVIFLILEFVRTLELGQGAGAEILFHLRQIGLG